MDVGVALRDQPVEVVDERGRRTPSRACWWESDQHHVDGAAERGDCRKGVLEVGGLECRERERWSVRPDDATIAAAPGGDARSERVAGEQQHDDVRVEVVGTLTHLVEVVAGGCARMAVKAVVHATARQEPCEVRVRLGAKRVAEEGDAWPMIECPRRDSRRRARLGRYGRR